jgi:predicted ATPase
LPNVPATAPANSEAIELFAAQAGAALSGLALNASNTSAIERICRRLEGIPLAIELTAARVKVLEIEQIATRVDDSLQLLTRNSCAAASPTPASPIPNNLTCGNIGLSPI